MAALTLPTPVQATTTGLPADPAGDELDALDLRDSASASLSSSSDTS